MTTVDLEARLRKGGYPARWLAEEVRQAAEAGRSYSIVACAPQILPGERADDLLGAMVRSVRRLVRRGDLAYRLDGDVLAVVAPGTPADGARALTHRLQCELTLRSAHLRATIWEAGFASLSEDGTTLQELLQAAIEDARTRRRRAGVDRVSALHAYLPYAVDPDVAHALQLKGNERPGRDRP